MKGKIKQLIKKVIEISALFWIGRYLFNLILSTELRMQSNY